MADTPATWYNNEGSKHSNQLFMKCFTRWLITLRFQAFYHQVMAKGVDKQDEVQNRGEFDYR